MTKFLVLLLTLSIGSSTIFASETEVSLYCDITPHLSCDLRTDSTCERPYNIKKKSFIRFMLASENVCDGYTRNEGDDAYNVFDYTCLIDQINKTITYKYYHSLGFTDSGRQPIEGETELTIEPCTDKATRKTKVISNVVFNPPQGPMLCTGKINGTAELVLMSSVAHHFLKNGCE